MAGTWIFVLSMVGCVVFAYAFGVSVGYGMARGRQWVDGRLTKLAHDHIRNVSGRLAAGVNDDYDLGYSEGVTDADLLHRADKQRMEIS